MAGTIARQRHADHVVNVTLTGGRVTHGFRSSLFAAAERQGVSVNEFVLLAAAEKLRSSGFSTFNQVFHWEHDIESSPHRERTYA